MKTVWQNSYGAGVPNEINPDAFSSVVAMCDFAIDKFATRTAFHCGDDSISFAELGVLSTQFSAYLQTSLGVKKGDRIAVMTPNVLAFPVAFIGVIRSGAVQVNVNPMYTSHELKHQLNDANVETIIVHSGSTPILAEIIAETNIKTVIVSDMGGLGDTSILGDVDPRITDYIRFTDAVKTGVSQKFIHVDINGKDGLFLQYTGGTTGLSKGASLSHRNLVANTEQFKAFAQDAIQLGNEVTVTALPLYHIFALMVNLISYVSVGGTNYLVSNPRDIDGLIDTMATAKPTAFTGVNTLFNALIAHPRLPEVDLSYMRMCIGGGAAVHASTSKKWKELTGQHIREGYGLSETGPILTLNPFNIDHFSGSVGLPVPSTDIKMLDDDGNDVPQGEEGEICASGPQIMSGYWNRPDTDHETFTKDGYFRTGDIGVFTDEGYIRIVDRKKDMVIVSGFNVYPNEIEATVAAFDGIAECACIGVPNDRTGEALRLFVVRQSGSEVSDEDIISQCRRDLTAYKVPRQIVFVPELPKSTVGKILRRELRDI